jgi:hypothetical protein
MKRFGAFALVLVISLFTATAFAQSATTSVRGVVKDATGAVLPNATVTLTNVANAQVITAKTNKEGEYQLQQILPAKYSITVNAKGFSDEIETAELLVNKPATLNFTMSVKGTNEVVDVSASAQTLNVTDASLGGSKGNEEIQALPSETRNVPDLLSLQPGVLFLPNADSFNDSRSGAVNGGRSDQGNITIDGVDDNDQVNGTAFFGVLRETQDSIEEFRVTTGNGNADEGRSSGAQVSLVTKSGTNKYHGAAYEYNRPSNTVSNDFFNKQGQLASGEANRPPKLIRNIFGGDVGGPIFKDKLFFFANYEGERQAESKIVVQTTPCGSNVLGTCIGGATSRTNPNSYFMGALQYPTPVIPATNPPTDKADVLTPAQVANVDIADAGFNGAAECAVCNTAAYPYGPGPDPAALAYFKLLPPANGVTEGDQVNTGSYTFASPAPVSLNTTIVRLDYLPSSKHRLFVRGNLQKDVAAGVENLPGEPASSTTIDNTKGIVAGDTWTISSKFVNDIRYGYIRQASGTTGIGGKLDYVDFRVAGGGNLATPTAETRNFIASVPVNNIVDNFNFTEGKHNFQVGGNWRLIHQNRLSDANSYNSATTNPEYLSVTAGPYPSIAGYDPVDNANFGNSYLYDYSDLVGSVGQVSDSFNYKVTSSNSATLLGDGTPIERHYKANEYEGYIQDAWRIRPNLTVTVGGRYSLLQTPWETKGQQVTPTIDTNAWAKQRESAALMGAIYEPTLTFAPSGEYYGKAGFYPKAKNNIAPRFAIVYAPDNKTSIRAGAGMYYDHFGQGLINTFDQEGGGYGLSTVVTNPASIQDNYSAARFTGRNNLPYTLSGGAQQEAFPFTPSTDVNGSGFAIAYGIDNKIKTPYSEAYDFSVQRELPGGLTLETNYVGRYGQHLLQALDLAQPVDYVDPQGGGDYYAAGAQLSKFTDMNGGYNPNATLASGKNQYAHAPTIAYFENVFPYMKNYDYNGESATQAIYTNEWAPERNLFGATSVLQDIDVNCFYGCPPGHVSRFFPTQFSSLYTLSTIGKSYYNALEVTLHHPTKHGLQFDVNYTFSKSIDWGSDAERVGALGGNSAIINTWKPKLNQGVSDFDTTHLLTINFVDQLPLGRGKMIWGDAGRFADTFVGGWQLSGIYRLTSGLPFSVFEPGYTTDYEFGGFGIVTDPSQVKTKRFFDGHGNPQYFANAAAINSGGDTGGPIRYPYPGETGERNNFRGDGYNDLDLGLNKSWTLGGDRTVKFAWEVYNVENIVHFDPFSINTGLLEGSSFGVASAELTAPRRMQFSLRYDF